MLKFYLKLFSIKTLLESDCEEAFDQIAQEGKPLYLSNISRKLTLILNKKNNEDWAIIGYYIKLLDPHPPKYHFSKESILKMRKELEAILLKINSN